MSDGILEVRTSFKDVATLGQGWTSRVDGTRVLLPVAGSAEPGDGVRFIVYLVDGTPAFAGAGRCVDVVDSDTGNEVLVEELQFDERSRPVYDYLVAVRASLGVEGDVTLGAFARPVASADGGLFADALAHHGGSAPPVGDDAEDMEVPTGRSTLAGGGTGSLGRPSLIPTGGLTRPARGLEWEPAPPRHPIASGSSGLFDYEGGIPRPARPPYPDLDRSMWVTPAPRPGATSSAAHVSAGPTNSEGSEESLEDAAEEIFEDTSEDDGEWTN